MKLELVENGPIKVTKSNGKQVILCRCGLTKNAPYCDNSHLTARRGFPGLIINDELPRSDYRDWEYQNQLDEQERIENCLCENGICASCAEDDGGCECRNNI
jgi:CDGSH-type Zn-finger protein